MTKFLNISTDTTLGGSSASDDTVSSQKAIKAYVDSQTGTAPAFANITGQPTDNTNLAAALDKKENIPYISLYNGSSGNPRPIKFLTVDYTNANSENGVFIKITMQSSHGNGVSYAFLQDAFFNINYTGTISCEVFKYFGATTSYDGSRQYGDIFWVHDSENKIVDFYTLMGQFSALYSTPYRRLNQSTGGEITQLTTASTYSEGTQVWASCGDYYTTADPVLTNLTTNATSLTIKGNPISPACGNSINIGYSSSVGDNGEVCVGVGASTRQIASTAIGFYASATKTNAIQIGTGTNSTANTFYVGFRNENNYLLLDGATGLIPLDRMSVMTGADGTNAGTKGLVPAPSATDNAKYLKGNGTYAQVAYSEISGIPDLSGYVPTSRTVNSKALSSNITLTASDVGAVATNTAITGATKCKITYDSKGLVTAGADLQASDIPDISATYQTKLSSSNKLSTDYISGLATVATSGSYNDLSNKPTIPTVNNATLTIQKNGTTVKTFTANASTDVTANITVPTKVSDLTNDSGFITGITSSDVTTALGYTPYNSSNPSGYQANVIETVKVNGTALTPSSKAVDITVPTETTVSGWGFTKNAGTVTSVNNVSPVSGNVTLSIPTVTDTYSATSSNAMSGKAVASAISGKQDTLVSGTSIKTINSTSLLGSGNIAVQSVIDANNKLDYAYLSNTPTIPTVNNATLTITQGGVSKGTFTANASSDVTIDLDAGGGSAVRNIGEIVQSTIPLSDAGLHLLDGGVISGNGAYSAFVTYIAGLVSSYPDLFDTEANWQSSVSTYGVCGKFVYDSVNGTVRLPKITGFTEGTIDPTTLGDLTQAGLPNITYTDTDRSQYNLTTTTGALSKTSYSSTMYNVNVTGNCAIKSFDASLSNSIYGNSNTVQPQSIKVLYYIVIATSTKTQIEVDIDEIATDLNGKADVDLSNCTKPHIVETYVNGTEWYRVWSDGWCEQGGVCNGGANISVQFMKEYIDTNINIQKTRIDVTSTNAPQSRFDAVNDVTVNGFTTTNTNSGTASAYWKACGYIS